MNTPPGVLYHYTSIEGFRGIISDKCLWATYVRYMNDSTEYMYAYQLLRDALDVESRRVQGPYAAVVRAMSREYETSTLEFAKGMSAQFGHDFVVSLSTKGDQLGQWRAYCPNGGYSIGLMTDMLQSLCIEQEFELLPCSYDGAAHRAEATKIAEATTRRMLATPPEQVARAVDDQGNLCTQDFWAELKQMRDDLTMAAGTWKHPVFSQEEEWRLVSRSAQRALEFRAGKKTIIPYVKFSLEGARTRQGDNIVILNNTTPAPCAEPHLAASAAMLFLQSK